MTEETSQPKSKSTFREYTEAIIIALLLALFIRTFVVQAFKIPSGSMLNTLLIGDHILVNKFIYGIKNPFNGNTWIPLKKPQRRDVVVFKYPLNPKQDYIKRVVGVEGRARRQGDQVLAALGVDEQDTVSIGQSAVAQRRRDRRFTRSRAVPEPSRASTSVSPGSSSAR